MCFHPSEKDKIPCVFSQPLPMAPKLFGQSVACPCCKYANDSMFRYCQSCGYKRKILTVDQTQRTDDANLDVSALDNRLLQIANLSAGTSYSKKKSSLQKESEFFLAGRGPAGYHGTHWNTRKDIL